MIARFDGDGMVHAVRIEDGAVTYTNKFVRTQRFMKEKKLGYPAYAKVLELIRLEIILFGCSSQTAVPHLPCLQLC